MALFGKKKEEEKVKDEVSEETADETVVSSEKEETKSSSHRSKVVKAGIRSPKKRTRRHTTKSHFTENVSAVLVRPRITEKATFAAEKQAYVFEVAPDATKRDIFRAVKHYYKVTPIKVNLVRIPRKKRQSRTRRTFGVTAEGKKAYVFLKKGDTLEFV